MHLPHLARFVSRLLGGYAALFEGPHSARLHHELRRIADAGRSRPPRNRSARSGAPPRTPPRTLLPERLWSEISEMPAHCDGVWWRDPRCDPGGEG